MSEVVAPYAFRYPNVPLARRHGPDAAIFFAP